MKYCLLITLFTTNLLFANDCPRATALYSVKCNSTVESEKQHYDVVLFKMDDMDESDSKVLFKKRHQNSLTRYNTVEEINFSNYFSHNQEVYCKNKKIITAYEYYDYDENDNEITTTSKVTLFFQSKNKFIQKGEKIEFNDDKLEYVKVPYVRICRGTLFKNLSKRLQEEYDYAPSI